MHVTRLTTLDELVHLARDWNCLTRGVPLRSWQWLFNWWPHYRQDRELYVLAVRDRDGSLVGAAPCFLDATAGGGRVIKFLGSEEVCSDYLSLLTTHEHQEAVLAALAEWLTAAAQGAYDRSDRWDLIDWDGVAADDQVVAGLMNRLKASGCAVTPQAGLSCQRVFLPATWEAYLASLSKSRRTNIKRVGRKVAKRGARVLTAADDQQLETGMRILVDLHQRRRNSLGQAGCFASPAFAGFLDTAAPDLLAAGFLQLSWLELEDRPAAIEFCLTSDRTCYMYQSGIEPDAMRFAPGHVLTAQLIADTIQKGRQAYDLLRGDEPYKAAWGARPVPMVRWRVVPRRLLPRLRHGAWLTGQTMKHWVKSGLALAGLA